MQPTKGEEKERDKRAKSGSKGRGEESNKMGEDT